MSDDGPKQSPRQRRIWILPPRSFWRSLLRPRKLLEEVRAYVGPRRTQIEQALQVLRSTEEGSALMSVRRPIVAAARVPRQFWGALAFRPFILIHPGYVERPPEELASTLAHEYGHLRQQRCPFEWIDSVEQENLAEQAAARFRL